VGQSMWDEDYIKAFLVTRKESEEVITNTPSRVYKAYTYILGGSDEVAKEHGIRTFPSACVGIVEVADIPFYSMCEHHMLPFFGSITIKYRPNGRILGLSKFPRIVNEMSRSLQVQEGLTSRLHAMLCDILGTINIEVTSTARHMCMEMRGICARGVETTVTVGCIK